MRLRTFAVGAALAFAACSSDPETAIQNAALETDDSKASYGIGLNVGRSIADTKNRLDRMAFMRGVNDALAGSDPAVAPEELQGILQEFAGQIQAEAMAEQEALSAENVAAGEAYRAENGQKEGVTTLASGVQYEVITAGDGPMPLAEQQVRIHYTGTLIDGTEFDSSVGGDPLQLGAGQFITGFTEALLLMPVGSTWRVVIPGELAYGPQGTPSIPPMSTLVFQIELLEIVEG